MPQLLGMLTVDGPQLLTLSEIPHLQEPAYQGEVQRPGHLDPNWNIIRLAQDSLGWAEEAVGPATQLNFPSVHTCFLPQTSTGIDPMGPS